MASLLSQLSNYSQVVVDAGDLETIARFQPSEVSITPAVVLASVQQPQYQPLLDRCLQTARELLGKSGAPQQVISTALQHLFAQVTNLVLGMIKGRVSVCVDVRLGEHQPAFTAYAQKLYQLIQDPDRLLIQMPATTVGIATAQDLARQGISTHLSLVFGLHQAIAGGQVSASLVSLPIGRIADWYKQHGTGTGDPSTAVVRDCYSYLHQHHPSTQIMVHGFRNLGQVLALAGCDLLCISPGLWADLQQQHQPLTRQLTVQSVPSSSSAQPHPMAVAKLDESLRSLSRSFATLENLFTKRLQAVQTGDNLSHAAHYIFQTYDVDGDGYITREEWIGSDAVFDALDRDKDGRITPTEIAIGLGILL